MHDVVFARMLHVLGVVIWIGGLSMATTVVLPGVRRGDLGADQLKAFHAIERRFVWQARAAMLIVGLSGLYVTARLDLWDRFTSGGFWWMHAMVGLWLIFAIILFIAEPFILHQRFQKWATRSPDMAFAWLHRTHWLLLIAAFITILGAVAGSLGWSLL